MRDLDTEKETSNQLLDILEFDFSKSEEIKKKHERQTNFSLHCILFLTESFFRLCNILQNLKDIKHGVQDFLDKVFFKDLEAAYKFIQEKRNGLMRLQDCEEIEEEGGLYKGNIEKLKAINGFLPIKACEIKEIYKRILPKEMKWADEVIKLIKEDEIFHYFLSKEHIIEVFEEFSLLENWTILEIFTNLQQKTFISLEKEVGKLFIRYKEMIKGLLNQKETILYKILYLKPEFEIEKTNDYSYFESESFKESINKRLTLFIEVYGLKKPKISIQKDYFFFNSEKKNIERKKIEKENQLEEDYYESLRQEIKDSPLRKIPKVRPISSNLIHKKNIVVIQGYKDLLNNRSKIWKFERLEKEKAMKHNNSEFLNESQISSFGERNKKFSKSFMS